MANRFVKMKLSVARHGPVKTALRYLYNELRRLIDFEVCVVQASSGAPYTWPDVQGYKTRVVEQTEFLEKWSEELKQDDLAWPFQRGDVCTASVCQDEIVGFNFYTFQDTIVRDGLTFRVPQGYVYSFKSFTAPSHRGRKLEPDRWKASRAHRNRVLGKDPKSIFYINVTNLESLAANKMSKSSTLGYAAYALLFERLLIFNSPGCKRHKTGFARTSVVCD